MSAALVSLLVVSTGPCALLNLGSIAVMVPVECECSIILGGGSAAPVAVLEDGLRVPGAEATVKLLGAECCHLAVEILDPLQTYSAVGELVNTRECWLDYGLSDVVCIAGCGVHVTLRLAGESVLYIGG
jgi:hypothetical protein